MRGLILVLLAASAFAVDVQTVRQKFQSKANTDLKDQIVRELQASYLYQAYSYYFSRADVSLPGFAKFFSDASKEERAHAEKMMEYINKRGGEVELNDIKLQDVCDAVSTEYSRAASISTEKSKACICYFMSQETETFDLDIQCGTRDTWFNGLMAMEDTLMLERYVNEKLLAIHSNNEDDAHFSHLMEHEFLDEQVESIKEIGDKIRQLRRVGQGVGEYLYDQKMQG